MSKPLPFPAASTQVAMYVRMSSDLQKYSIRNQEEAIQEYAAGHVMTVARTYRDQAKSGVRIENRAALKQLLNDVQTGAAPFSAILVYDVSRWGRFQNTDQAAYYDYLCRMHGIEVIYVAEQFANDGSPFAAILKNLKRAMAAEYSRELSIKCKAGQTRLARLGFTMGGSVLFGMRRLVLNEHGEPRVRLAVGERKSIQSDHVVLIPGPDEEIALVRRIFRLFASNAVTVADIVRLLKIEGLKTHHGVDFGRAGVRRILRSEAYIGNNVWGKTSVYLGGPSVDNAPEKWVRRNACFEAVIAKDVFAKVQRRLARTQLQKTRTREQLLDDLRTTLIAEGKITTRLVADRGGAFRAVYRKAFGSLLEAYRLVGYVPDPATVTAQRSETLNLTRAMLKTLAAQLAAQGFDVSTNKRDSKIEVDGRWQLGLLVTYELGPITGGAPCRWRLCERDQKLDMLVIARMDRDRQTVKDYFVVPKANRKAFPTLLRQKNTPRVDALRADAGKLLASCIAGFI